MTELHWPRLLPGEVLGTSEVGADGCGHGDYLIFGLGSGDGFGFGDGDGYGFGYGDGDDSVSGDGDNQI